MNCLEFRRVLLARPRERTAEQKAHLSGCAACAKLATDAAAFEARLEQLVLVSVRDGLAERVLLRHSMQRRLRYPPWALAASVALSVAVGTQLYRTYEPPDPVSQAIALAAGHPAVAVISFVVDYEPQILAENGAGDPQVMMASFKRLGLKVPLVA